MFYVIKMIVKMSSAYAIITRTASDLTDVDFVKHTYFKLGDVVLFAVDEVSFAKVMIIDASTKMIAKK